MTRTAWVVGAFWLVVVSTGCPEAGAPAPGKPLPPAPVRPAGPAGPTPKDPPSPAPTDIPEPPGPARDRPPAPPQDLPPDPDGPPTAPDRTVMDPPFGGQDVRLDWYAFGGIAGNAGRIRVVGEEATRFRFGKVDGKDRLTSAESEKLAQLLASVGPINRRSRNAPGTPDGMASGFFFPGRGTGNDESEVSRFVHELDQRLGKLPR